MSRWRLGKEWAPAWIVLNGALAGALLLRMWSGSEARSIVATPARPMAIHALPVGNPASPGVALDGIERTALFYTSRQFYVPPPASAQLPKPNYRITGTFIVPNKPAVAMVIQNGGNTIRKVAPGDDLDGWTVLSVDASKVTLRLNNETYDITRSSTGFGNDAATTASTSAPVSGLNSGPVMPASSPVPVPTSTGIRVLGGSGAGSRVLGGGMSLGQTGRPRLFQPPPPH